MILIRCYYLVSKMPICRNLYCKLKKAGCFLNNFYKKILKISLVILVPYKIYIRKLIQLSLSAWSKKSRSNGTSIGMIALLSFSLQFTNLGEIRQSAPFMEHYCKYYRQGFVVFWNQLFSFLVS